LAEALWRAAKDNAALRLAKQKWSHVLVLSAEQGFASNPSPIDLGSV
jgi:hypothetical protein